MEKKHFVVFICILIAAVIFWFTLPQANEIHSSREAPIAPWMTPDVQHLSEHGIRIGPHEDADIRVTPEGDSFKVEIVPSYLQKQGAEFLITVGMLRSTEIMSEERFMEFVEALHMTVLTEEEKAGHTHEHEEGEALPHPEQDRQGGGLIDRIAK